MPLNARNPLSIFLFFKRVLRIVLYSCHATKARSTFLFGIIYCFIFILPPKPGISQAADDRGVIITEIPLFTNIAVILPRSEGAAPYCDVSRTEVPL